MNVVSEVTEAGSRGLLLAVIGPSGSGKDTLIRLAREAFSGDAKVLFVRRTVTREADRGAEDHDTLTPADFGEVERNGEFAVTWDAHGLRYGLPSGALSFVNAGGIAVANCSRRAMATVMAVFPQVRLIRLHADAEILARRLANRGREPLEEIRARVSRTVEETEALEKVVLIDNSGPLEDAAEAFIDVIAAARRDIDRLCGSS
ncbi:phosphonate metabolism protein/1,5-bisphosphokinase (PRPP-forming) PhnN [Oricola cellulosilytica]|nr:phosphonate metabolism protein/1,5-bisphosphokinase (PRPP-forming) PhnN [Oricola cellulosilytica]